ncbi:hypothetical protein ACFLUZ_01865 [Chloroflexota bacterium]
MIKNISLIEKVEANLKDFPIMEFREDLLSWWESGKRQFPWRETHDPYKVLIAEILLHRTKAEQVVPFYWLFIETFPNIQTLASSTPDELNRLFYSIGLSWRWKLLHEMAIEIDTKYMGQIPEDFEQLTSLPGISHYIASSLRCFAFDYSEPILDTNTVRIAGRLIGLTVNDTSRRSRLFKAILQSLLDSLKHREFNFALLDFAATMCKAKIPLCSNCPLSSYCAFYSHSTKVDANCSSINMKAV